MFYQSSYITLLKKEKRKKDRKEREREKKEEESIDLAFL
jgi:hypothetical protein